MSLPSVLDQTNLQTTNVVAGGAVTLPFWYHYLENVSQVAAVLLPIVGLLWLVVQIIVFTRRRDK